MMPCRASQMATKQTSTLPVHFLPHELKKLPPKEMFREEFVTALMSNHLLADQAHP
jgi:hypothetical protein